MTNFEEIPGFSNYLINANGEIWSKHVNRLIKSHRSTTYQSIKLVSDFGISTNVLIHRLLAFVFLDLPALDSDLEVDHRDRDTNNYSLSNLQILTKEEHLAKTLHEKGVSSRPNKHCTSCGKPISKTAIGSRCKSCNVDNPEITAEQIQYWVVNFSWTRAAAELGLSDNGLRKRFTKLTGLKPKDIHSPLAQLVAQ